MAAGPLSALSRQQRRRQRSMNEQQYKNDSSDSDDSDSDYESDVSHFSEMSLLSDISGGHFEYEKLVKTRRWRYLADPLIRRGYRVTTRPAEILYSLFEFHNETINVWLHLVGALFFVATLVIWTYSIGPVPLPTMSPFYRQMLEETFNANFGFPLGGDSEISQTTGNVCDNPAFTLFTTGTDQLNKHQQHTHQSTLLQTPAVPGSMILSKLLLEKMSAAASASPLIENLHKTIQKSLESMINNEGGDPAKHQMPPIVMEAAGKARQTLHGMKEWLQEYATELNVGLGFTGCTECVSGLWQERSQAFVNAVESLVDSTRMYSEQLKNNLASGTEMSAELDHATELVSLTSMLDSAAASLGGNMPTVELIPHWPLYVYMLGASICLLASAVYHLSLGYDKDTFNMACRVDLAGITFMILGSFFPPVVYTFYCQTNAVAWYLGIQALLTAASLTFCMLPEELLHNPSVKRSRILCNIASGMFAIAPIGHIAWQFGITSEHMYVFLADGNLVLMGVLYLGGAYLYTSRFPESVMPGRFDYFLSSHQLWHVCVLLAALLHYHGSVNQYHWRKLNPICLVP